MANKEDNLGFVPEEDLGFQPENAPMDIAGNTETLNAIGSQPEPVASPSRMGELKKMDEAAINAYGLNNPEKASADLVQGQRLRAFAEPALNMAVPIVQPSRELDISRIKKEAEIEGRPITSEEAIKQADYQRSMRQSAFPTESNVGLGAGLMAAGAMLPTGDAAVASKVVSGVESKALSALGKDLTESGLMAVEGGITNLAADKPKNLKEAVAKFSLGTVLSALPLAVLKAPGFTRNSWEAAKEYNTLITQKANRDIQNQVQHIDNELTTLNSRQNLTTKQETRLKGFIDNAETEMGLLNSAREQALPILGEQPKITGAVAELPDKIYTEVLGSKLKTLGQAKEQMLNQVGNTLIKVDKEYETAVTALNKMNYATPEAKKAVEDAKGVLDTFQGSLRQGQIGRPADVMTGFKGNERTIQYGSAKELDAAKQQIQDLLYNKEWRKNAPVPVRKVLMQYENTIRNKIAAADPSGQLRNINEAYSAIKDIQFKYQDLADQSYFIKLAKDKLDDPSVRNTYDQLLNSFNPRSKGGSISDNLYKDPIYSREIAGVKKDINDLVESRTNEYGRYLEAKKLVDTLDAHEARLSDNIDRLKNQYEFKKQAVLEGQGKIENKMRQRAKTEAKKVKGLADIVLPSSLKSLLNLSELTLSEPASSKINHYAISPLSRAYEAGNKLATTLPGKAISSLARGASIKAATLMTLNRKEKQAQQKMLKDINQQ